MSHKCLPPESEDERTERYFLYYIKENAGEQLYLVADGNEAAVYVAYAFSAEESVHPAGQRAGYQGSLRGLPKTGAAGLKEKRGKAEKAEILLICKGKSLTGRKLRGILML